MDTPEAKALVRSPNGGLKALTLGLSIVNIVLARAGNGGDPILLPLDHSWLVITTTCSYFIITLLLLVMYAHGGLQHPPEALALFLGFVLYMASGSVVINYWMNLVSGAHRNAALALGSTCIITGVVMFVDLSILGKKMKK